MLVLSRKRNEFIQIGEDIRIVVVDIRHGRIRLGIEAPENVRLLRGEIYLDELRQAEDSPVELEAEQLDPPHRSHHQCGCDHDHSHDDDGGPQPPRNRDTRRLNGNGGRKPIVPPLRGARTARAA